MSGKRKVKVKRVGKPRDLKIRVRDGLPLIPGVYRLPEFTFSASDPNDLESFREIHAWLTRAIAYLEQEGK